jgi:replication factor C subunit 3/5
MITKKLYWSKYRPKSIEAMILLERNKKLIFKDDKIIIDNNLLLCSPSSGTGKTSLANILVPKNALKINASYSSGIDSLREEITTYCRTADIFGDTDYDGYKIVYLDEFDGVSKEYQDALRGFIEEHENNVRFIATCNNLNKIIPALQSRFTLIDFEPNTQSEINYLKEEYLERCILVKEKNKLNIEDAQIKNIIDLTFPDLRSVMNTLQTVELTGSYDILMTESINIELYNLIFSQQNPENTYNWIIENFGDNVSPLLKLCGRSLISYIIQFKQDYIKYIPSFVNITTQHNNELQSSPDPLLLACSCIFELKEKINTNLK